MVALAFAVAAWQLGSVALVHGKAAVAQWLIAGAGEASRQHGGGAVPPWPWADSWPVARLRVPTLAVEQYVLAGISGEALAFGPGLDLAGARPGEGGPVLLAGHRDTHFRWLQQLALGDALVLEAADGRERRYRVTRHRVLDSRRGGLAVDGGDALFLVTCYPLDAVSAGGPLRYVVEARPDQARPDQARPG
jgi:sortase A